MQDGTTADLIWDVPALVEHHLADASPWSPATSSPPARPAGSGVFRDPPVFLEPGDRVRCEIEGIGTVENPIVDWTEVG